MGNAGSVLNADVHTHAQRDLIEKRATAIYVSPTGSDSAAGTLAAPLKSIQKAIDKYHLPSWGTYALTTNLQITKSGTANAKYTLTNYQSEKVIIDGEGLPYTPAPVGGSIPDKSRGILHITGSYGGSSDSSKLVNGPYGVYSRDASNNHYERLVAHDNYETGIQIQGAASNNLVLNVDSYGNRDPRKNGESADGIGIKEGSGTGNVIRGSRFWNNVDDGLDFWEFLSPVTIENCYSWGNGFNRWGFSNFAGDGNGYKLGGGAKDTPVAHVVKNSMAFNNAAGGFVDNTQPGKMVVSRNTAWNNIAGAGFDFADSTPTISGNIAVLNKVNSQLKGGSASGNSWQSGSWSNSSFISLDSSTLTGPRAADGLVRASNFLLPKSAAAIGASYV
ncbi:pectate lyase [Rhizoctonia solani]|uniref:Pectate lyase n=1 Tax=Rhizoctonia solani TaxID=456999 RepID=A0A8H8NWM5_9AGAM|nr:pectate lyase [Rhizoctonia solani]QRW21466.1 pectate lyase [Rhizoctonia solani]